MTIRTNTLAGALLVIIAALVVGTAPVLAAAARFHASTSPVPHSAAGAGLTVSGQATLKLASNSNNLKVHVTASGLSPSLPHLMHIHGVLGAQNDCPNISADAGGDGFIDTLDGLPDYGPVLVTFSTSGDTSAAAAFNLGVAVVADSTGHLDYSRTFKIPADIANDLSDLHIVIHGADLDESGAYDGVMSSLGMGIPLEAELPVSCGAIN